MGNKIYSVGYSRWKDLRSFIECLKTLGIKALVDVRRFPISKNLSFKMEDLRKKLEKNGIRYICLSNSLGGFRKGGYKKHMETKEYKEGIRKLIEASNEGPVAMMCLESKSKYCHRRFITQTLSDLGVEVTLLE